MCLHSTKQALKLYQAVKKQTVVSVDDTKTRAVRGVGKCSNSQIFLLGDKHAINQSIMTFIFVAMFFLRKLNHLYYLANNNIVLYIY